MPYVKVTGYLELEDHDLDDGPMGPITMECYERLTGMTAEASEDISLLEELTFEEDDR